MEGIPANNSFLDYREFTLVLPATIFSVGNSTELILLGERRLGEAAGWGN